MSEHKYYHWWNDKEFLECQIILKELGDLLMAMTPIWNFPQEYLIHLRCISSKESWGVYIMSMEDVIAHTERLADAEGIWTDLRNSLIEDLQKYQQRLYEMREML